MDSVALQCLSCKETPDRLAVCTVVRAVTHRLHLRGGGGRGGLGEWGREASREGADRRHCFPLFGLLENPLIWLARGGAQGEAWAGGPGRRAGRGQIGGATREQCRGNEIPFVASLKTRKTGLIWLATKEGAGEGGGR